MAEKQEKEETKDVLPDDLDITKYVGPYQFPSPKKRKTASYSILILAFASLLFGYTSSNTALLIAGLFSVVIGLLFMFLSWPLNVKDIDALTVAASSAPFSVGHASAQLCFYGWLSKPLWRVVVFSSDEPPTQRGLVEINAVSKDVTSTYFEVNEDA